MNRLFTLAISPDMTLLGTLEGCDPCVLFFSMWRETLFIKFKNPYTLLNYFVIFLAVFWLVGVSSFEATLWYFKYMISNSLYFTLFFLFCYVTTA